MLVEIFFFFCISRGCWKHFSCSQCIEIMCLHSVIFLRGTYKRYCSIYLFGLSVQLPEDSLKDNIVSGDFRKRTRIIETFIYCYYRVR